MEEKRDIYKRALVGQESDHQKEKYKITGLRNGSIGKAKLLGERNKRKSSLSLENKS